MTTTAVDSEVLRDLAPRGVLRAALNFGNSVLVQRDGDGNARGISVDLANELGRRLGVPVEFIPFDAAGKVVQALRDDSWDMAFLAIDPTRAAEIAFSSPYVLIEGAYIVREDSPLTRAVDVDRAGVRVGAGRGAAYELYLSRTLKHATVERTPTAVDAFVMMQDRKLEVAAGVRQVVERYARERPELRVLMPSFMAIEQALGMPAGRAAGARYLETYIEEQKAAGFVAAALQRSGQGDVTIAPARAR